MSKINTIKLLPVIFGIMCTGRTDAAMGLTALLGRVQQIVLHNIEQGSTIAVLRTDLARAIQERDEVTEELRMRNQSIEETLEEYEARLKALISKNSKLKEESGMGAEKGNLAQSSITAGMAGNIAQKAGEELREAIQARKNFQANLMVTQAKLSRVESELQEVKNKLSRSEMDKERAVTEMNRALTERDQTRAELDRALTERDQTRAELDRDQALRNAVIRHLEEVEGERDQARTQLGQVKAILKRVTAERDKALKDQLIAERNLLLLVRARSPTGIGKVPPEVYLDERVNSK